MNLQQGSGLIPPLTWSAVLGKRVRDGDWSDQAVATSRKINSAIEARKWEQAAQLVDYWMEEAKVLHDVYSIWFGGFVEWLGKEGVPQSEIDSEIQRLRHLLSFPGGMPFDPSVRWIELAGIAGVLANRMRVIDLSVEDALKEFDRLRELWYRDAPQRPERGSAERLHQDPDPAAADGCARGDRRPRGLPRLGSSKLHQRLDHQRQRRTAHLLALRQLTSPQPQGQRDGEACPGRVATVLRACTTPLFEMNRHGLREVSRVSATIRSKSACRQSRTLGVPPTSVSSWKRCPGLPPCQAGVATRS